MFIIFGGRNREKQITLGQFYCPTCLQQTTYAHMRVSRYFTLYFIPLFPMQNLGEYLCCQRCQGKFSTNVLQLSKEQIDANNAPWKCPFCNNTNPAGAANCLGCQTPRIAATR